MKRLAVFLCVFLILNEVGPAHFRRLKVEKEKHTSMSRNGKRWSGATQTLLGYAFKAIQISGNVLNQASSILSIVSTVYTLLQDCEDTSYGPETKRLNDEIKTMTDAINAGSSRIYDIQLETKALQIMVETLNYNFNNTLEEMNTAGYLSERLLQNLSPDIEDGLNQTTLEIEEMLQKAQEAGNTVDYVDVSKKYFLRIDKSVKLAIPLFTSLIPNLPKISEFAKTRLANFKGWKISNNFQNIRLPGSNTKAYRGLKSWFSKTTDYIKTAKVGLRNAVTSKYTKALKVVKGLQTGFTVLSSYVFAAFNIYTAVQNFQRNDCRKLLEKAQETHKEVVKANETYTEILANVTNAKEEMILVKDDMLDQVSNEVFLEDLMNMKENMISIQGDGRGMQDMIDATELYLSELPDNRNIDAVVRLMNNLYENAIGTLPFIYNCLNDRSKLVSDVIKECKKGSNSITEIIKDAKGSNNFQPEECEKRTGIPFFSDQELENLVNDAAEEQDFNKECPLNNEETIQLICEYRCRPMSADGISRRVDVEKTQIESVIEKCPLCEVTKLKKKFICNARKEDPPLTDQEIHEDFPEFTLEQIAGVQCPS